MPQPRKKRDYHHDHIYDHADVNVDVVVNVNVVVDGFSGASGSKTPPE